MNPSYRSFAINAARDVTDSFEHQIGPSAFNAFGAA